MMALLLAVVSIWSAVSVYQAPGTQTGLLMVRVIDAQSRQPLADAVVTITGPTGGPPRRQLADGMGRAAFVALVAGSYHVRVQAPGYLEYGNPFSGRASAEPVVVAAGQMHRQIEVSMFPTAAIRGLVTDQHGQPLADVVVHAGRVTEPRDEVQAPWPPQQTRTNDLGEYGFADLLPGAYVITTTAKSAGLLAGRMMVRPSVVSDVPVIVGVGDVRVAADLVVPVRPAVRISGRVVGAATSQANCSLQLLPTQGVWTRCDPAGNFVFDHVVPGAYVIQGTPGNQAETWWIRRLVDVPDHDLDDLVLTRESGLSVRGSVRHDTRVPSAAPASVEGLRVTVDPVRSGDSRLPLSSRAATVDADGTFTVHGLAPGRYRFRVTGARGFVLGWIVESGRRQYAGTRDIDRSQEGVELILTDRLSRLEGHVDGRVDADVLLFPLHEADWVHATGDALRFRRMATDDNGAFVFADVPAGEYGVLAVSRTTGVLDWTTPSSLRLFAITAARVSLDEKGTQTIRVAASRSDR